MSTSGTKIPYAPDATWRQKIKIFVAVMYMRIGNYFTNKSFRLMELVLEESRDDSHESRP